MIENGVSTSFPFKIRQIILSKGRVRRRLYFLRSFLCFFLIVFIGHLTEHPFFNLFILAGILYFLSQTIKRLHDFNFSGWWTALMIVPLLNILFGLFVSFKKGTLGNNKYGSDPKIR